MTQHQVPQSPAEPLEAIFSPRSVAVIGASETQGSVGRTVLWNLIKNPFGSPVYPVNPKRRSVLGIPCHQSIAAIPDKIDLAVVCTPAGTVPDVIRQCADAGVRGAIIISAGFKELGPAGVQLEQQVMVEARRVNMRIIGPNCLGVMSPITGLNATFAAGMAQKGTVAFLSQSGALCTAVLDWSLRESVGFSAFVSTGSMLDVGWGDLISHFGDDPHTKSILIYMESIGDVRPFLSAAREVALSKPIIMIKAGRTAQAAKAAASHTGALAGSDDVLDAAFKRAGVLRVDRISDLFYMAEILSKQPRPQGPRLTIVTNAGGPGVLATDALVSGGGELTNLSEPTIQRLNSFLPPHWSRGNPVDILGDANAERYAQALQAAVEDVNSDALLVVLTPQDMTDATATAELLKQQARGADKPVLASWMGGDSVEAGKEILNKGGIPTFDYPDSAARAFNYMWRYSSNLKALYQTPELPADDGASGARSKASAIVGAARLQKRTILTETESKQILAAYDIPVVPTEVAATRDYAVRIADEMGYPVVLKIFSHTITHKTDVGGVQLNLGDANAVARAFDTIQQNVATKVGAEHFQGVTVQPMVRIDGYELILGSSVDAQFGPVLLFGLGGQLVEVFKDRALGLPPLNATLARRLIEQTRIYKALQGVRGRSAVDLAALERILVRFSQLVIEQPWIKEIDINPLIASPKQIIGLDARVVLHDPQTPEANLPQPAIRAYPAQYVTPITLKDGTNVTIRPIRPEDEPLMVRFHGTLSEQSVRFRYFHSMKLDTRIAHDRLLRVCFADYDRQIALVAERRDPKSGVREIIAVGRLSRTPGTSEAEFALLVSDAWQGRGLGTRLLQNLIAIARDERIARLIGTIVSDNLHMRKVCERLGLKITPSDDPQAVYAIIDVN